jgi:hypothetical protein
MKTVSEIKNSNNQTLLGSSLILLLETGNTRQSKATRDCLFLKDWNGDKPLQKPSLDNLFKGTRMRIFLASILNFVLFWC